MNISLLGGKIWNEIVELIGFDKEIGPDQRLYFIMILGDAYKEPRWPL